MAFGLFTEYPRMSSSTIERQQIYMNRCIALARQALGHVAPNPMVGAILVKDDKIVAEGFHEKYGGPHAEIHAIEAARGKVDFSESTLYVNLEPCSHQGKTPPCADLIISSNIRNVVVGALDTNPLVAGKGIAKMAAAGVNVVTDISTSACRELNKRFYTFHEKHRPYIILKWAQSSEGFMGADTQQLHSHRIQLSGVEAMQLSHKWRTEEQAIMVGTRTAIFDNPSLTARLWPGRNPLRVAIDKELSIPATHDLLNEEAQTLLFNSKQSAVVKNIDYVKTTFASTLPNEILKTLYTKNVQSVIVEGGRKTLQTFIDANLWDEARVITTRSPLCEGVPAPALNLTPAEEMALGEDILYIYYPDTISRL